MDKLKKILLGTAIVLVSGGPMAAIATSPQPQTPQTLQQNKKTDTYKKAADNKIFAQKLADEQMQKNADLIVIGIHAVSPTDGISRMIATNLDRVGKEDDLDDLLVARDHKTLLAPNLNNLNKFEVQVPMEDAKGHIIGALGLVFKYPPAENQIKVLTRALEIKATLAKEIPSLASLYQPQ